MTVSLTGFMKVKYQMPRRLLRMTPQTNHKHIPGAHHHVINDHGGRPKDNEKITVRGKENGQGAGFDFEHWAARGAVDIESHHGYKQW
jgi:hypothetical protein